jgi:hypothetical protein
VLALVPLCRMRLWSGFHCCRPEPDLALVLEARLPDLALLRSVFLFRSVFLLTFRLLSMSMSTFPPPQLQWFAQAAPQAIPQAKPTPNETNGAGYA